MPNLLLDLEVDRVDLVDEGANSEAHIKLYKRKEHTNTMEFKDIVAKMKPEHAAVLQEEINKAKQEVPEEVAKSLEDSKQEVAALQADLAKAKTDLEEVAKSKPAAEPSVEDVIKGLDPAVQEMFKTMAAQKEAAEAIAKSAAEKALTDQAIAKAKELKSLPVEEAKLVDVLKDISPEVHEILKAANQAIEDSGVLEEVGKSASTATQASNTDEAWAAIEKAARQIADEEKMTIEKATGEAVKRNPELYATYLKGEI